MGMGCCHPHTGGGSSGGSWGARGDAMSSGCPERGSKGLGGAQQPWLCGVLGEGCVWWWWWGGGFSKGSQSGGRHQALLRGSPQTSPPRRLPQTMGHEPRPPRVPHPLLPSLSFLLPPPSLPSRLFPPPPPPPFPPPPHRSRDSSESRKWPRGRTAAADARSGPPRSPGTCGRPRAGKEGGGGALRRLRCPQGGVSPDRAVCTGRAGGAYRP